MTTRPLIPGMSLADCPGLSEVSFSTRCSTHQRRTTCRALGILNFAALRHEQSGPRRAHCESRNRLPGPGSTRSRGRSPSSWPASQVSATWTRSPQSACRGTAGGPSWPDRCRSPHAITARRIGTRSCPACVNRYSCRSRAPSTRYAVRVTNPPSVRVARRRERTFRAMPRCSTRSSKRRTPLERSRKVSNVQRSPMSASVRAIEQVSLSYALYGGGGWSGFAVAASTLA